MNSNDQGIVVSFQRLKRGIALGLLLSGGWIGTSASLAWGQTLNRKAKTKIAPAYPELAKRLKIGGVVKILITVAPNGSVKETKLMGGHPVLAMAALDAVKGWRFEPGPDESAGIIEFRFDPPE